MQALINTLYKSVFEEFPMSGSFLLVFISTVFIASIIPGPSMLLALNHGMQYGFRRTVASAMGNVTVTLIQASVSIVGLGTILLASKRLFTVVKWAGALYLIILGLSFLLRKQSPPEVERSDEQKKQEPAGRLFLQGALVTASNPKAIVFFTAVFPQFISPESRFLHQSVVLLSLVCIIAFTCFMIYAMGGERVYAFFSNTKTARAIRRLMGITFIGSGIGLASS